MRAVVQERYGSADELEVREVPRPEPGEGEVLVRVRAASLHPDVWHVVVGRPWVLRLMGAGLWRPRNPIPGTDMAGVVEETGPGTTRFSPGDAVFGETLRSHQWTHGGAFAEYVAVREEWLAAKPGNVTFEEAASFPSSGFIALLNFRDYEELEPGDAVLVNGAGGGVGTIALQLARSRGARVTAVDGPAKLELLRSLGADEVVDYTVEDFTRRGVRYDLVFDVPGDRPFSAVRRALEPDGMYRPVGHDRYGAAGRRVFGLVPHFLGLVVRSRLGAPQLRSPPQPPPTRGEAMSRLRSLVADGVLTPVLDRTYPLDRVREAFRRLTGGEAVGKVILSVAT